MATRKKKIPSPSSWLRSWRQKLTSRTACFMWGAIFGNALLSQPINPLNLLLEPPERMLSPAAQSWLQSIRNGVRSITTSFTGTAVDVLREKTSGLAPSAQQLPQSLEQLGSLGSTAAAGIGSSLSQASGQAMRALSASSPANASAPAASPPRTSSTSDFAACADQFPAQQPLHVAAVSTQWAPLALCSDAFAVLYSGLTKTPLIAIEKLNRARLQQASGLERTDQFYADSRIPAARRAELSDYQGSGYDRGHLSAAANQPNPQSMAQSFALSNMVPQDPTHNRKLWSKLESDVRKYVQRSAGDVFVFTGALYEGSTRTTGRNQVWVPSHLFKLVYDEREQRAWAYVLPNQADAQITRPMDYASFVQRTHWNLLAGRPVTGTIR